MDLKKHIHGSTQTELRSKISEWICPPTVLLGVSVGYWSKLSVCLRLSRFESLQWYSVWHQCCGWNKLYIYIYTRCLPAYHWVLLFLFLLFCFLFFALYWPFSGCVQKEAVLYKTKQKTRIYQLLSMGFYIFIGLESDVCIEGGGGWGLSSLLRWLLRCLCRVFNRIINRIIICKRTAQQQQTLHESLNHLSTLLLNRFSVSEANKNKMFKYLLTFGGVARYTFTEPGTGRRRKHFMKRCFRDLRDKRKLHP